jgi:hypothetical protein
MKATRIGLGALFVAVVFISSAAQAQTVRVRGTIEQVESGVLTVKSREGDTLKVKLAAGGHIIAMVKASLDDIKPGLFVGATALPEDNGRWRAVEVHILPEAQRGVGEGDRANDYRPKSTMTNGTVNAVGKQDVGGTVTKEQGASLTLKFKDGEKQIDVMPDTVIYTYADGSAADLMPGARVSITGATKQPDGTLMTARINVGRGVAPPM